MVGVFTSAATLFGGGLALRFRSALTLFLGFSSGAVIGVALFDLLPEALEAVRRCIQTFDRRQNAIERCVNAEAVFSSAT